MPARIRLQRKGKKRAPYYHIVAADSRSTRDGKYIERLGHYNPNVNPADIKIDREKALQWIKNGAQPSDTMRAILQYSGVMYQLHLDGGVKKGALTQEQADEKLTTWLNEKASKVSAKREKLTTDKDQKLKAAFDAEVKVNEERAAKILAKTSALAAAVAADAAAKEDVPAEGATEVATEATNTEVAAEATESTVETTPETLTTEAPTVEATPETPVAEAAPEASAAEAAPEAPVTEAKTETPAEGESKPDEGSEPDAEEPKGE